MAQIFSFPQTACVFQNVHYIPEHSTHACGVARISLLLQYFFNFWFLFLWALFVIGQFLTDQEWVVKLCWLVS